MEKHRTKVVSLLAGLIITGGALWFAVRNVNWADVRTAFAQARYSALIPYLACLLAFYLIKTVRWRWLLLPVADVPVSRLLPPMVIGFAGNNLLPARLGEFIRIFVVAKRENLSIGLAAASIVLERVFDVITILVLFCLAMLTAGPRVDGNLGQYLTGGAIAASIMMAVGILGLAAFVAWTQTCLRIAKFCVSWLPVRWSTAILSLLEAGAHGLTVLRKPRLVVAITIASFLHWCANVAMVMVSMWAFDVPTSWSASVLVLVTLVFAVAVPSVPGFFGVIQAAFAIALEPFGVSAADAFAISVFYLLAQYIPVTGSGLYFLNRLGLSLVTLSKRAEQAEEKLEAELEAEVQAIPSRLQASGANSGEP